MTYEEFLKSVRTHGGPGDNVHADAAAKQVLAALGQRLTGNEPRNLASQLPPELQEPLLQHNVGEAEIGDELDDFLRRIADREGYGCSPEDALAHSRSVLSTVASFVSTGEITDLRSQLPTGYAALFETPQ